MDQGQAPRRGLAGAGSAAPGPGRTRPSSAHPTCPSVRRRMPGPAAAVPKGRHLAASVPGRASSGTQGQGRREGAGKRVPGRGLAPAARPDGRCQPGRTRSCPRPQHRGARPARAPDSPPPAPLSLLWVCVCGCLCVSSPGLSLSLSLSLLLSLHMCLSPPRVLCPHASCPFLQFRASRAIPLGLGPRPACPGSARFLPPPPVSLPPHLRLTVRAVLFPS